LALSVRIKPRALRQIEVAAAWWAEHRPAAPGAVRLDLDAALGTLAEHPGIGSRVENSRGASTRRLYLARTHYFAYYRVRGRHLEVVAFWHASRESTSTM
jgi:plasmid stabilization system protein ParE